MYTYKYIYTYIQITSQLLFFIVTFINLLFDFMHS